MRNIITDLQMQRKKIMEGFDFLFAKIDKIENQKVKSEILETVLDICSESSKETDIFLKFIQEQIEFNEQKKEI